jgi:hypothetical protein
MKTRKDVVNNLIHIRSFLQQQEYFLKENKFSNILINSKVLLESIENRIKSECKHEYEEDDIDISPDESKHICYCKICFCTFPFPN